MINLDKFTPIKGYDNYLITEDGLVYNRKLKRILRGSKNPAGYRNVRISSNEGIVLTWGIHRLLAYVFIPYVGDLNNLVVNHIDGNKSNNSLSNLEWTTHKGNLEHAGRTGLSSKCTPISIRNAITGEVKDYPSITECSRHIGVHKDTINYRVTIGEERVFLDGCQYRVKTDKPWYMPKDLGIAMLANTTSKSIQMLDIRTGKVTTYDKLSDLSSHLKISPSSITRLLTVTDQPVITGLKQLKMTEDTNDWINYDHPYLELEKTTGKRVVVIINDQTKEEFILESAADCADIMFLKPTAMNYRLKSKGSTVYSDGFRYCYYSDYVNYSPLE